MLRVSLLGEQTIADDRAGSVRAGSSRAVALVAFLVVHAGSPQARQRIAGLFWPESGDAQALTNLRRELHHLRQVLGDEPSLVVTSRDLCWRDTESCHVDVRVFDIERKAALAAAAAGDDNGILLCYRVQVADGTGTGHLQSLVLTDTASGARRSVPADALFVLIGAQPRTQWLGDCVARDRRGFILTGPDLPAGTRWPPGRPPLPLETSLPGVFAAGDVRRGSVNRVASAVGEGAATIPLVHRYLARPPVRRGPVRPPPASTPAAGTQSAA